MSCAIFFAPSTIPPRQLHTFHGRPLAQRRHPESTVRQHVLARAPKQAGCKTLAHTRLSFARLPPRRGPPSPVKGASQASCGARWSLDYSIFAYCVWQHARAGSKPCCHQQSVPCATFFRADLPRRGLITHHPSRTARSLRAPSAPLHPTDPAFAFNRDDGKLRAAHVLPNLDVLQTKMLPVQTSIQE